ncbi:MAG: tetratricopeptide repeat protein [Candidatus Eisenbacteria bacterium]|uniref:Tetratricopeptide repeat protein n=1 Tax=Eiseniibacteriota bacterium TaxID=2212470 RepID=A0A948S153_UNCEI|nr:tetratricopeptide repeat protein [Candidatus Eisenbacteria bacterium]MBU1949325.1 tetratricopeptide repeat protein [Candidatus Eisenbacteria bacterium]MBU2692952.1 tetratricopeptide repeat protein [Candidatus Eisenbacteria bacterium]
MDTRSSEKETQRLQDLETRFKQCPDDEILLQELLDTYRSTGRSHAAAELLRLRIGKHPGDWSTLRTCVMLFLQAGESKRAAEILNQSGSEFKHQWEFWRLRGSCLEGLDRFREALEEYRRAAQLAPEEAEPRFRMGLVSLELGEDEEALGYFHDALERDTRMGGALVNLGLLYERMGDTDRAVEMLRRVLELEPENVEGHLNLGTLYAEKGYGQEAAAEFHRAAELDDKCIEAHFNLGLLLEESEPDAALDRLRKVLAMDPTHQDATLQIGRLCYKRGLYTAALKALHRGLDREPKDTRALYYLALTYNKLDRPDETIRLLDELLRLEPDNARAHFYQGIAYDKKGAYQKAQRAYQKADELGSKRGEDL